MKEKRKGAAARIGAFIDALKRSLADRMHVQSEKLSVRTKKWLTVVMLLFGLAYCVGLLFGGIWPEKLSTINRIRIPEQIGKGGVPTDTTKKGSRSDSLKIQSNKNQ